MTLQPLAQEMFHQYRLYMLALDTVEKEIIKILGRDPEDERTWGFDDITTDHYDSSFELKSCREEFVLTDQQKQQFSELGFQQCWFCTKPAGTYDPGVHVWFPERQS
jgi:hypothetical protein